MVASLLIITIMAHVNARFRDAGNIASMGVQIGFFVTPVLFPPELLLEHGRAAVVQLNPFYHLLEVVRRPLLAAEPAAAINYAGAATFDLLLLVVAIGVMAHFGRRVVFSL